jgi:hypothetical protein
LTKKQQTADFHYNRRRVFTGYNNDIELMLKKIKACQTCLQNYATDQAAANNIESGYFKVVGRFFLWAPALHLASTVPRPGSD